MSRIIIMSSDGSAPVAEEIRTLREAAPMRITNARRALVGETPLIDIVVFENDHEEVAAHIRGLCRSLEASGRHYRIYELAPEESWCSIDESLRQTLEITPSALENILDREASRRR